MISVFNLSQTYINLFISQRICFFLYNFNPHAARHKPSYSVRTPVRGSRAICFASLKSRPHPCLAPFPAQRSRPARHLPLRIMAIHAIADYHAFANIKKRRKPFKCAAGNLKPAAGNYAKSR